MLSANVYPVLIIWRTNNVTLLGTDKREKIDTLFLVIVPREYFYILKLLCENLVKHNFQSLAYFKTLLNYF